MLEGVSHENDSSNRLCDRLCDRDHLFSRASLYRLDDHVWTVLPTS